MRTNEWNLKPDKIKLGKKPYSLNPERIAWNTLQRETWIQYLLTSSDRFLGNPFYRAVYRLSREITGTCEGLQSLLLGRCFKLRIAIYFSLVTVGNKELLYSCATVFRSTQCAIRNVALQTPSSAYNGSNPVHLMLGAFCIAGGKNRLRIASLRKRKSFPNNSSNLKGIFSTSLFHPPVKESFYDDYIINVAPLRRTGSNANCL